MQLDVSVQYYATMARWDKDDKRGDKQRLFPHIYNFCKRQVRKVCIPYTDLLSLLLSVLQLPQQLPVISSR